MKIEFPSDKQPQVEFDSWVWDVVSAQIHTDGEGMTLSLERRYEYCECCGPELHTEEITLDKLCKSEQDEFLQLLANQLSATVSQVENLFYEIR